MVKADLRVLVANEVANRQEEHRRLMERAVNVLVHEKQAATQLSRVREEKEKVRQLLSELTPARQKSTTDQLEAISFEYAEAEARLHRQLAAIENEISQMQVLYRTALDRSRLVQEEVSQSSKALQEILQRRIAILRYTDLTRMQRSLGRGEGRTPYGAEAVPPEMADLAELVRTRYSKRDASRDDEV